MKRMDVVKTLSQGAVKQQIKLFFTDIALRNIYPANEPLLTPEQRQLIYNRIKADKDIRFYDNYRSYNGAFLIYRYLIDNHVIKIKSLNIALEAIAKEAQWAEVWHNTISQMIEAANTGEKSSFEEELSKIKSIQASLPPPQIDFDAARETITEINKELIAAKEAIEIIKAFLNKVLPLLPYKDFLKEKENNIRHYIAESKKNIETHITVTSSLHSCYKKMGWLSDNNIPETDNNISERLQKVLEIIDWEDIRIAPVTDEDIDTVKRAGV